MKPTPQILIALAVGLVLGVLVSAHHYTFHFNDQSALVYRINNWTGEVNFINGELHWVTVNDQSEVSRFRQPSHP